MDFGVLKNHVKLLIDTLDYDSYLFIQPSGTLYMIRQEAMIRILPDWDVIIDKGNATKHILSTYETKRFGGTLHLRPSPLYVYPHKQSTTI